MLSFPFPSPRSPSLPSPSNIVRSLAPACANAFDYGDPKCLSNSTLYLGTGEPGDLSCAHCVCEDGWGGVDCGRCLDVSVCPGKRIDGHVRWEKEETKRDLVFAGILQSIAQL